MQALSSVEDGYDLLAPKFDHTPFRTPDASERVVLLPSDRLQKLYTAPPKVNDVPLPLSDRMRVEALKLTPLGGLAAS